MGKVAKSKASPAPLLMFMSLPSLVKSGLKATYASVRGRNRTVFLRSVFIALHFPVRKSILRKLYHCIVFSISQTVKGDFRGYGMGISDTPSHIA
jgi:hypothetical protein